MQQICNKKSVKNPTKMQKSLKRQQKIVQKYNLFYQLRFWRVKFDLKSFLADEFRRLLLGIFLPLLRLDYLRRVRFRGSDRQIGLGRTRLVRVDLGHVFGHGIGHINFLSNKKKLKNFTAAWLFTVRERNGSQLVLFQLKKRINRKIFLWKKFYPIFFNKATFNGLEYCFIICKWNKFHNFLWSNTDTVLLMYHCNGAWGQIKINSIQIRAGHNI